MGRMTSVAPSDDSAHCPERGPGGSLDGMTQTSRPGDHPVGFPPPTAPENDSAADHATPTPSVTSLASVTPGSAPAIASATASASAVITADRLRRSYSGGFEAVAGISFSVGRGELFALLGTNGAGKTSTVELLEPLARPSGGTVRVLGHDPYTERAEVRPRVGVMLQEGGFPSDLTVAETVRMVGGCTSGSRPVGEAQWSPARHPRLRSGCCSPTTSI
jgi:ABC-type glutathione transport system ATPase component